jgi:hypothetical protein
MALPVPKKTFQPHPDHDIIADDARGRQVLG